MILILLILGLVYHKNNSSIKIERKTQKNIKKKNIPTKKN